MQRPTRNDPCPCGSALKFKKCCEPALTGAVWPATPEALMRSRYSAFATGNAEHLWRTTHPEHEAVKGKHLEAYIKETLGYCRKMEFTGLQVLQTWEPDPEGTGRVLFTASYRAGSQSGSFTELSDFVRQDGRWVYLRGDAQEG